MEWLINWWPATVAGPIILGGVIAYALLSRRRLTSRERADQKAATEKVYRENGT